MKKLLLFDIDGTLVNLNQSGLKSLIEPFKKFFDISEEIIFNIDFFGKTDIAIYEEIMISANKNVNLLYTKIDDVMELYLNNLKYEISKVIDNPVIAGVKQYLDIVNNSSDYFLGLLTGNIEKGAYIKLKGSWNLDSFFNIGAFGSDSKNRSDLVNIAVSRAEKEFGLGFKKENVFVIGDTELDIKCAKDNKVKSVAVATGKYDKSFLKRFNPDFCVDNLMELDI